MSTMLPLIAWKWCLAGIWLNQSQSRRWQLNTQHALKLKPVEDSNQIADVLKNLLLLTNNNNNNNVETSIVNGGQKEVGRDVGYPSNNQLTKMEFPKFLGTNVEGWFCRVEYFFSIDATPEEEKV